MFITRKDLRKLGASDYQVRKLTKNLLPAKKEGNIYQYNKLDLLRAIDKRMKNKKIRKSTLKLLQILQKKIEVNHVEAKISQNLLDASQELGSVLTEFKKTIQKGRKISKKISKARQKSKEWNQSHPEPGINNIISVNSYKFV